MTKPIRLPIEFKELPQENQRAITIDLQRRRTKDWCLSLCLLEKELVEYVNVVDEQKSFELRIGRERAKPASPRGRIEWRPGGADLVLPPNELEHWLAFFLKYYRDGVGQVSEFELHIGAKDSNTQDGLSLFIRVPKSLPPLSENQLRQRLGLPPVAKGE